MENFASGTEQDIKSLADRLVDEWRAKQGKPSAESEDHTLDRRPGESDEAWDERMSMPDVFDIFHKNPFQNDVVEYWNSEVPENLKSAVLAALRDQGHAELTDILGKTL